MKKLFFLTLFLLISFKSFAVCEVDVSKYVGWKIIYSGIVTGYINDGVKEKTFDGCEPNRVLLVDYTKQITCAEFKYSSSFQPDIVLMSNDQFLEACIDGDMYSIY